jgi:cytochrome c553
VEDFAMTILVLIMTLLNGVWAIQNWRHSRANVKTSLDAASMQASAELFLKSARKIFERSKMEQEFAVCSECHRLVTRHDTDENGKTTCVNCAANLVKKA